MSAGNGALLRVDTKRRKRSPFHCLFIRTCSFLAMGKSFFNDERKDLLLSFMDQYKGHKEAGTLEEFWPVVIPAYIAKFKDDNMVETPKTHLAPKTKCGKPSQKHDPDQPKPLREVRFLVNVVGIVA